MAIPEGTYEEKLAYYRAQFDALVAAQPKTDARRHEATVAQNVHVDYNNSNPDEMRRLISDVQKFVP